MRRTRKLLGWLPELLVLALVAAAFATQGLDLSEKLFGADPAANPAAVPPPEGLDLVASDGEPPVASPLVSRPLSPAAVRRALAPYLAEVGLGPHSAIVVSDLGDGTVAFRRGDVTGTLTPASTLKLLTGVAALEVLGPDARFRTATRLVGNRLFLVGGGDPYLEADLAAAKDQYPPRGDLGRLAQRTAVALKAQGVTVVRLSYDTGLFTGPALSPAWPPTYLPEDVVPPITALWVDQGEGADGRYVTAPAALAGSVFVKALARYGVRVVGPVAERRTPAAATEVASIASAPVDEIVEHTIAVSDNNAAEVLARHVGLEVLGDASFAGGARAIRQTLAGLGVPMTGARIFDGSGLSRKNRLVPATLLAALELAASAEHPDLRAVITGLPVAGFTGSLQNRFEKGPDEAKGRVRAKTGTLTGVHGLAGVAIGPDGSRMAFVAIADRVGESDLANLRARADLDLVAAALGACRCGGPRTVSP